MFTPVYSCSIYSAHDWGCMVSETEREFIACLLAQIDMLICVCSIVDEKKNDFVSF